LPYWQEYSILRFVKAYSVSKANNFFTVLEHLKIDK
jgi:hypothetical protein